jgi:hypothetical protein
MPLDHLKNDVLGLADAAKAAEVPILLFSSGVDDANGPVLPELLSIVGDTPPYHRSTVNLWADEGSRAAITGLRRRQLVLAAVMTDSNLVSPSISLMSNGFKVYTADGRQRHVESPGRSDRGAAFDASRGRSDQLDRRGH